MSQITASHSEVASAREWSAAVPERARPALGLGFAGRSRLLLAVFALALLVVGLRLVQLEASLGEDYRRAALIPVETRENLPAARGRILARDGTVLAFDKPTAALTMHYRYLQLPPDESWLRRQARMKLPRGERGIPEKVRAAEARFEIELDSLHARLGELCQVSSETWEARRLRITRQVTSMAASVNERRRQKWAERREKQRLPDTRDSWFGRAMNRLQDLLEAESAGEPAPIVIAEELAFHVLADDLPLAAAAAIESRPDDFPQVQVITRTRRYYPQGSLAAHVIGYLGSADHPQADGQAAPHDPPWVGKQGVEAAYEPMLAGRSGSETRYSNRSGELLGRALIAEPQPGGDIVLTLDPALQHSVESLIASAVERNRQLARDAMADAAGGAIVVIDVERGNLLAAASAPSFDPGAFMRGDSGEIDPLLTAADHPLFNRFSQMAQPPGSVFKMVTGAAAMERGVLEPEEHFYCQGFLNNAGGHRCAIFLQHGVGHGELALEGALAESCNVFFFRAAQRVGSEALTHWAHRLGYGQATGCDLPGEASGNVPNARAATADQPWREGDTLGFAIGQGTLTATPLQVAVMTAAIANGGMLVKPHVVARVGLAHRLGSDENVPSTPEVVAEPIEGLRTETLQALREGMEQAVRHPRGTAYAALGQLPFPVAGKTGTAEVGGNAASHAWFAGYAPADHPQVAIVVVLEHGGSGGATASLIAARTLDRMQRLGYFRR